MGNNKGVVLIVVLAFMLMLVIISLSYISLTHNEIRLVKQQKDSLGAFFLAEAGVEKAIFELSSDDSYPGEYNVSLGGGVYDVSVTVSPDDEKKREITATGYVPDKTSPRAGRKIKVEAARPSNPVTVAGALMCGGDINVKGSVTIHGGDSGSIVVPEAGMVSIQGAADVTGIPEPDGVLVQETGFAFEEVFGLTEEQMKSLSTVYTDPEANVPDPANGVTWVEGDAHYSASDWSGDGILVVTGDLRITGGTFSGVIYAMGQVKVSGNAQLKGSMISVGQSEHGEADYTGNASITYDADAVYNSGTLYPYETEVWEEIAD